ARAVAPDLSPRTRRALTAHAVLADRAHLETGAAVLGIAREIRAARRAGDEPGVARADAHRARRAGVARREAIAAVGVVVLEVGADAVAVRLTERAAAHAGGARSADRTCDVAVAA